MKAKNIWMTQLLWIDSKASRLDKDLVSQRIIDNVQLLQLATTLGAYMRKRLRKLLKEPNEHANT